MITVDIINLTSSLSDADAQAPIAALQAQAKEDFEPAWGFGCDLHFVPRGQQGCAGHWWIGLFDNSDQPGALGYHDLTSDGLPFGKVFVVTDAQYGEDWRVTLSHELLEQLLDPWVNLCAFFQTSDSAGTLVAYEASDPVQGDTYQKQGVTVSNFVLPAYFEPTSHPAGTKFDFMGLLNGEFPAMRPGGYYSKFDVASGGGWQQVMGDRVPARKMRAHNGSRRELRNIPQHLRRRSTPK